jgi:hypothetical protein
MRGLIVILVLLAVGAGALYALVPGVRTHDMRDALAALAGEGKVESLAHEPLVMFVPEQQHFKIAFPGKPIQLNDNNSWLHQTVLRLPCYMVADKEVSFYASERQLDSYERLTSSIDRKSLPAPGFTLAHTEQSPNAQGNNELVKQSSTADNDVMKVQRLLDTQCEQLVASSLGTVKEKYPADLGGGMFPGRMVSGTMTTTDNKFRLAVYYDPQKNRLFSTAVVGAPARVDSSQANQFFKSMSIWP